MKLVVVLLTVVSFSHAQHFAGKIVYAIEYKSKLPSVSNEQFASMMGTSQEYFIKEGNYKSVCNGAFFEWQLYINSENRFYSKVTDSDTVRWMDAAVNGDEVVKSELNKSVTTILGYECDEIVLTCKSGVQKYYFSRKLSVDPKLFEKHKFGNWSELMSKARGLPLKMSIDSPQVLIETVATEIVAMKLDDKFFTLPADSKIEKSPY